MDTDIEQLFGKSWSERISAVKSFIRSRDAGAVLASISLGLLNSEGKPRLPGSQPDGLEFVALRPAIKCFNPQETSHVEAAQAAMQYFLKLSKAEPWALICYLLIHHFDGSFSYEDLTSLSFNEMVLSGWLLRLQNQNLIVSAGYRRFMLNKDCEEYPASMGAVADLRP